MTVEFRARGSRGEIWLYDQVGQSFWGDGISAKSFQKELGNLGKVSTITLHVNSPGGDVFDGFAIYNQLKQHPARIEVSIDGIAASIASIISMAGDQISIAKNGMMMIHNPHGMAIGGADEMERVAALLKQVKGNLVQTYVDRTGAETDQISNWMDDETWMTAETALQYGFVDHVTGEQPVTACIYDLSKFKNVPGSLRQAMLDARGATPARDMRAVRLLENDRRVLEICG